MKGMMKLPTSRALGIIAIFSLLYFVPLLWSSFLRDKAKETLIMFSHGASGLEKANRTTAKLEIPSFRGGISPDAVVGLVNMAMDEVEGWKGVEVNFQEVSELIKWTHLFPEWIDEDELNEKPSCPEIPMPDLSNYGEVDAVVARLPCRYPAAGWTRDVSRLQAHLAAASLAARRAKRDDGRAKLIFLSRCQPMMEIFRAGDLVKRKGDWWFYESDAMKLQLKLSMPAGSCRLAHPEPPSPAGAAQREAYATVLHTSQEYVCGAVVLAHSIRSSGSTRELLLLHDKTVSAAQRGALAAAGWQLRIIERIRNPFATKDAYNEYNYSKLRLWQLTDYDKVVFLDTDALVLRNVDHLFRWPEMSAAGNDGVMFNSGVMVLEPSNATFAALMRRRGEIVSYNGGDQGFLNEAFVWWHRLPRRVNFLKVFPAKISPMQAVERRRQFAADPAELSVVHYLGRKPWLCYRDYDCNWNKPDGGIYADDEAHWLWWRLHDGVAPELKRFCGMPDWRKSMLEGERAAAEAAGNPDGHWKIEVVDERKFWKQ